MNVAFKFNFSFKLFSSILESRGIIDASSALTNRAVDESSVMELIQWLNFNRLRVASKRLFFRIPKAFDSNFWVLKFSLSLSFDVRLIFELFNWKIEFPIWESQFEIFKLNLQSFLIKVFHFLIGNWDFIAFRNIVEPTLL